jgi:hypothetical protein
MPKTDVPRRPVRVKLAPGDFSFRVRPGQIRVANAYGENPLLQFVNETRFPVELRFPAGLMTNPGGEPRTEVRIDPGGLVPLDVKKAIGDEADVSVAYEARVYVWGDLYLEASGGSRPEIEIQR